MSPPGPLDQQHMLTSLAAGKKPTIYVSLTRIPVHFFILIILHARSGNFSLTNDFILPAIDWNSHWNLQVLSIIMFRYVENSHFHSLAIKFCRTLKEQYDRYREESFQGQVPAYREKRKREILANAERFFEGKKRKITNQQETLPCHQDITTIAGT